MKERNKKIIFKEIELQIRKFISLYKVKSLQIDGHEHIQMIPCIFNYIKNLKKKYKITEIRISNEKLLMPRINDFYKIDFLKNIIAFLTLKFFNIFLDQSLLEKKKFIGLVYTGHQNEDTIFKTINFYKNNKNTAIELLVHPGFTDKKERILFKKKYFKFYSHSNRKQEYEKIFSNKIKIFLKKSMKIKIFKSDLNKLPQYIELYKRCFKKYPEKKDFIYFTWLYRKNPLGSFIGIDAFDTDKNIEIGQVGGIPYNFNYLGKPIKILQSINVCVDQRYRGQKLFKKMSSRLEDYAKELNFSFIIAIANALATPAWMNSISMKFLTKLDVFLTYNLSEFEKMKFDNNTFRSIWDENLINWRKKIT